MVTPSQSTRLAERCEPVQCLQSRQKEVGAAADSGKGGQAGDLAANRPLGNLEFQCPVLSADDRIALIAELVEIPIIYPDVLRELELPDETCADHERCDAALRAVVGGALRTMRTIGRAAA